MASFNASGSGWPVPPILSFTPVSNPSKDSPGIELPAGDQFADLVVRHAALPEVVNLDLAGADVLAERVRLHLLVARVHPLLHVGVLFVNHRARADDAARQEERRVDCHREVQRALRERPRLGRRRDGRHDADQDERPLSELLDGVGVVAEPANDALQEADDQPSTRSGMPCQRPPSDPSVRGRASSSGRRTCPPLPQRTPGSSSPPPRWRCTGPA